MIKLYNEDCTKVLKEMKSESIDCIISDIPYRVLGGVGIDEEGGAKVLSNRRYKERMDKLKIKLHNEDCTKVLKEMKNESVDCVISDVPYLICQGGCSSEIGKDGLIHQKAGGRGIFTRMKPHKVGGGIQAYKFGRYL